MISSIAIGFASCRANLSNEDSVVMIRCAEGCTIASDLIKGFIFYKSILCFDRYTILVDNLYVKSLNYFFVELTIIRENVSTAVPKHSDKD